MFRRNRDRKSFGKKKIVTRQARSVNLQDGRKFEDDTNDMRGLCKTHRDWASLAGGSHDSEPTQKSSSPVSTLTSISVGVVMHAVRAMSMSPCAQKKGPPAMLDRSAGIEEIRVEKNH
jgi:hypothetical protein